MLLGFANFYRKFFKNFSKIVLSLILMLQTIGNKDLGALASRHNKDQDAIASIIDICSTDDTSGGAGSYRSIKNLFIAIKSAKLKKPNFVKADSGTNFLMSRTKEAFIYL